MNLDANETKMLFLKCKKSVQEIIGWKAFIFLPQNNFWRSLILATVFINTNLWFTKCAYLIDSNFIGFIEGCCDLIYIADVVLAMMHYAMLDTRKLRHGKKRHIALIVMDCFSLLPLTMAYDYLIYNLYPKDINSSYFRVNICLRTYRIPKGFSEIKTGVYKLKAYFVLTILEMFIYIQLLSHFFSCILVLLLTAEQKKKCQNNYFQCLVENELVSLTLLLQDFIPPYSDYSLEDKKLFLIIIFFVGYFFVYGFIIPVFLFVSLKCLAGFFDYARKWRQLKILIKTTTEIDKKLKKKILNYFRHTWYYGKGDRSPEILNLFPMCLKKNIFCDLHWDAITHSHLLHSLSLGCKRSIALCMRTEFVLPGTILYEKNEIKNVFIYLESGMLQIMSEENSECSVANFSGGTVLGEITFFLHVESSAILRAAQFSVVHFLNFKDFFKVLSNYPKDLKKVTNKFDLRMKLARSTYFNKTEIKPYFSFENVNDKLDRLVWYGNIKWIKRQYRTLSELREAEKKTALRPNRKSIQIFEQKGLALQAGLDHTSAHLSLITLDEETAHIFNTVCLKKSFPWMLDPQCHFLFIWKIFISLLQVVTVLLYTAVIGWSPYLPLWFFNISVFVTLAYMLDVFLILFTAVKLDDVVLTKFSGVVFYNLSNLSFYVNIFCALPLQFSAYVDEKNKKRFKWNLYFANAMLRAYQLIPILSKWSYNPNPGAFFRTCVKNLIMLCIIIYWSAAVFNLLDIECILYECTDNDWYKIFAKTTGNNNTVMAAFFRSLITTLDIIGTYSKIEVYDSFIVFSTIYIFCRIFFFTVNSECIATYILEYDYVLEYKTLEKFIHDFIGQRKKIGKVRDRVMTALQFQWDMDKGHYITQNRRIFDDLSRELKNEIDQKGLFQTLTNSKLFESEDDEFKMDLCRKAVLLSLPAKSVLLTLRAQPNSFYVIVKGFVQINSFTSGDLRMNLSTPIILKESDAFPIVEVFSQKPTVISAIAASDCQLIEFGLEDFLNTLMIHHALKDVVEAVREIDLSILDSARLGVTPIGDVFSFNEYFYEEGFKKLKFLGVALKFLLRKKTINSVSHLYLRWEISRLVFILISLFIWPVVYAFCWEINKHVKIISVLLVVEFFWVIDFYVRLHVAFYNKKGLYVTHPLATAIHYLMTSFLVDVIAFIPNLHILHLVFKKETSINWRTSVIHVLLRSLSLYRIVGFIQYLQYSRVILGRGKLILYTLIAILSMHFYINLMVHFYVVNVLKPVFLLPNDNTLNFNWPLMIYFNEVGHSLSMFFRKVNHSTGTDLCTLIAKAVWAIFGYFTQIYLYSHLSLNSMILNKNLTTYRNRMKSFRRYLADQKIEQKVAVLVEEHFEHEWAINKGYELHKIFSRFPRTLQEDILYPLYKNTLQGVASLLKANESFFKSLSRKVNEVYLQKGSVIIYEKQVQGMMYFIHYGKCLVENSSNILYKGSIIGQIKHKQIMVNNIIAKTHVKLLKVSWEEFFSIIVNFSDTKVAFESEAAAAEDFIESIYTELEDEFVEILSLKKSDSQSEFVHFEGTKNSKKETFTKKERLGILSPESVAVQISSWFFVFIGYVSGILIPVFIALKFFSPIFLIILYTLDVFWILKIIVTMRTAYVDKTTGNIITNRKAILHRYIRTFNGLIIDVLSTLPIEVTILIYFGQLSKCCSIIPYFYANRSLRIFFVYSFLHSESSKLTLNLYKNLFVNLVRKIFILNFCACIELTVNGFKKYKFSDCYWSWDKSLNKVLLSSYLCVVDVFVGSGMKECEATNLFELMFRLIISVWALISRATFLNQVLTMMYVEFHTRSDKMIRLAELEKYLLVRRVSPVLFKKIKQYFCDLIDSFNEGAEPSFLHSAPSCVKTKIVQELYTQQLSNCYVFQNLDECFVKQLADRLERNIFFPGDYIVEKGDVDHNMYFINSGEVYCIEADKTYAALELEVDLYVKGEYFGVLQGIFLDCPHVHTFRAKTLTDILVLNYKKWADMREAFPDILKLIYVKCMKYETIALKKNDNN